MIDSPKERIARDGFFVLDALLDSGQVRELRLEVDRLLADSISRGGVRNALRKSERLHRLGAAEQAAALARTVLGPGVRVIRLTIFDKSPGANWKVPFHQDLTISVTHRIAAEGYGPWSMKDGILHVQPPVSVLERTVAVRVHLDDTPSENGALRVLPGSHKFGRIPERTAASLRQRLGEIVCPVPAGGALAMSPLLMHASSAASSASRRRVLHYEYSDAQLPEGLLWA